MDESQAQNPATEAEPDMIQTRIFREDPILLGGEEGEKRGGEER